jgi:hypothetical protein
MAQNFASVTAQLGTGTTTLYTNASSSPTSADAIIGIPPNSSVELVQGGAKFVLNDTDVLKATSSAATSTDVVVSLVKAISTTS